MQRTHDDYYGRHLNKARRPPGIADCACGVGECSRHRNRWHDFLIYGTAAALVFNRLFFPAFDPMIGTIAAFGSYAVGFVARPIGGAIIGHYGDRLGRKTMLPRRSSSWAAAPS